MLDDNDSKPHLDDRLNESTESQVEAWEVEQKYVVRDRLSLLEELDAAGFRLINQEQHQDLYLRHPSRDFRSAPWHASL